MAGQPAEQENSFLVSSPGSRKLDLAAIVAGEMFWI